VKVGVEPVEGVVSLPGPTLQLLPQTSKARRAGVRKGMNVKESRRRNCENPTNLEYTPRGTAVDPRRLVQRLVERSAVIAELLPQPLLRLGLDEVGRRRADMLPLLLRRRRGSGV
jgi:hypothetical protein